ncbi:fimbrial protein [Salmonella enterica]|nr:fimbrial protein [Salmonella enterica]
MKPEKCRIVALLILLTAGMVHADDYSATITVTVTATNPPCVINNNQIIDVDFGQNVVVTDVAAGTVEKPVPYTLDCGNLDPSKSLKMRITGNSAGFDNALLQTNIPELGIKLNANGVEFPLNTDLLFSSSEEKPYLSAALVQQPGYRLPVGEFSAGATMTVDYQ